MMLKNIRDPWAPVSVVCLAGMLLMVTLFWKGVNAQTTRSVSDGVFTEAQAVRGKERYELYCASCHGTDLNGGGSFNDEPAPVLKRADFLKGRGTLNQLYSFLQELMPAEAPGTLRDTTYVDITAYLLQQNGFPAGTVELKPDPTVLRTISVDVRP